MTAVTDTYEQAFHFTRNYLPDQLLHDPKERQRFFKDVLHWEGQFIRLGVGIANCGFTVDGAHIDGETKLHLRTHSNPSKEALHLIILALVVKQEGLARIVLPVEEAISQLELKATALEEYRYKFPEHHGYMPWFNAQERGLPLEPDIAARYNGMLAWALYFVVNVLLQAGHSGLAKRMRAHLDEMTRWAVHLFYKGGGKIAARVRIPPRGEALLRTDQNCTDPFAGELFCFFLDLLADWGELDGEKASIWSDNERQQWITTRALNLKDESSNSSSSIEVLLHGTFSAHEEWKYLFLPYTKVPATRRLLYMSEKARTGHARAHALPGLLGDCHVACTTKADTNCLTEHITSFGIPGISGLPHEEARIDVVAASGTLGTLLAEPAVGAAWLWQTLAIVDDMQTAWGMAESCAVDGSSACPLLTWDAKGPIVLAILGGAGSYMQDFLQHDGLLTRFEARLEDLYGGLVANGPLTGELMSDMSLPHGLINKWRSTKPDESPGADLEMIHALSGIALPASDGWTLLEVRTWFEDHQVVDEDQVADAPYCIPDIEDWYTSALSCQYSSTEVGREKLYRHIIKMFELGLPLVLLARQAKQYALFFDLDIYGGKEGDEGFEQVEQLIWGNEEKTLFRSIAVAILRVYPSLVSNLQMLIFCSSGTCKKKERYKASYHLVFPQIIVDRPVYAWPDGPAHYAEELRARHIIVRDHILYCMHDEMEQGGCLATLHAGLLDCCDHEVIDEVVEEAQNSEESPTFLNDWSEIFDEKPFWHEPWPEALSGMRLPFTDKHGECRPKLPLARLQLALDCASGEILIQELPDLHPVEWIRHGDISVCREGDLTPWDVHGVHEGVDFGSMIATPA